MESKCCCWACYICLSPEKSLRYWCMDGGSSIAAAMCIYYINGGSKDSNTKEWMMKRVYLLISCPVLTSRLLTVAFSSSPVDYINLIYYMISHGIQGSTLTYACEGRSLKTFPNPLSMHLQEWNAVKLCLSLHRTSQEWHTSTVLYRCGLLTCRSPQVAFEAMKWLQKSLPHLGNDSP